ncbi:MAG TPA: alpha-glucan family phosphorylase [Anaeromyxobacteraceae bacterium]|nr:alpha-glucan family phosphorylase [Anaeromyxobacteraceae bacterium]
MTPFMSVTLPRELEPLWDLALDLRWSMSATGVAFWRAVSPALWERSGSAWVVLHNLTEARIGELSRDAEFRASLWRIAADREAERARPTWFAQAHDDVLGCAAYFSMEFGLGEGLPLYAGGLGILAGDALKAASDLAVPLVGVGLLYQEGYFRQMVDWTGWQNETYPFNDPMGLPVQPARAPDGSWLRVPVELPGRSLSLRVWTLDVGRVPLLLLDSNDPLNTPVDRGITSKLYGGGVELRLLQEMALGIGGWRALEALGRKVDVCHLNEGHAALATLERVRHCMTELHMSFREAVWATRAGNVFTTHTPVAAGFDAFSPILVQKYLRAPFCAAMGISLHELLALGRRDPDDDDEPFNMATLALRLSARANGVSRLHGEVSRSIFAGLYPRWPLREVPVRHVTNGVHVPSWESPGADRLWTLACGKERWSEPPEALGCVTRTTDADLWAFRCEARRTLVDWVRERLWSQQLQKGASADKVTLSLDVLDPGILTLGFARRFAEYKRPNLLLRDPDRLARLLSDPGRPLQLVVAGKAHPADEEGKRLIRAWVEFTERRAVRTRVVFLEDYDIALARHLIEGVDVWVNTPRRPWEACGTSGMKVLANGGLNLSVLDGWWAEAYAEDVGWALPAGGDDAADALALYRLLEEQVVPAFYARTLAGIPEAWVARMRASMARLAPQFSATRMMREYVDDFYVPASRAFRRRTHESGGRHARELRAWQGAIERFWCDLRFTDLSVTRDGDAWEFDVTIHSAALLPQWFRVEVYAEPSDGTHAALRTTMERGPAVAGAEGTFRYHARVPAARPATDYTPRVIPYHPGALIPAEEAHILWCR